MNAQALIDWFNNAGFSATNQGVIYAYEFTPNAVNGVPSSSLTTSVNQCPDILSRRVSSNQWIATAGGAMRSSSGHYYDLIIKDNVYNIGKQNGGMHGGQPLANQLPPSASQRFSGERP